METNELYLTILPAIHISNNQMLGFGLTEQILTLFPERNFATQFFPDEVEEYLLLLQNREKYLVGGHVKGYKYEILQVPGTDRVIVRVLQLVG
jgi:hypothetical protein